MTKFKMVTISKDESVNLKLVDVNIVNETIIAEEVDLRRNIDLGDQFTVVYRPSFLNFLGFFKFILGLDLLFTFQNLEKSSKIIMTPMEINHQTTKKLIGRHHQKEVDERLIRLEGFPLFGLLSILFIMSMLFSIFVLGFVYTSLSIDNAIIQMLIAGVVVVFSVFLIVGPTSIILSNYFQRRNESFVSEYNLTSSSNSQIHEYLKHFDYYFEEQ